VRLAPCAKPTTDRINENAVCAQVFAVDVGSAAIGRMLFDVTSLFSVSYDELRSAAVKQCQAIDPAEYQSGLFFNPDGYRSY